MLKSTESKHFQKDFEGKWEVHHNHYNSIPDSEKNKETLTIKFISGEKSLTPKIIEVRLLNNAK
jgi:hypothetical protein